MKLGERPFWGFQGKKWREVYVFILNIVSVAYELSPPAIGLSDLWITRCDL